MKPNTYGNIHVAINLTIVLLLEGLCLWGLWRILGNLVYWILVAAVVFFVVAYLGHRWVPKLTGPIVDALIKDKTK